MKIEAEASEEEKQEEEKIHAEERERKAHSKTRYSIKEQWQKFWALPKGERFWYIWEYYKIHIFVFLAICFIIFMFVDAIVKGTRHTVVEGALLNINYESLDLTAIEDDYVEKLGLNTKRNIVTIQDALYQTTGNSDYSASSLTAIIGSIELRELDFIITEDVGLNHFGGAGYYADLSETLPEDFYAYLEENDRIVTADYVVEEDDEGNPVETRTYPAGILLNDTYVDEQLGFQNENVYFCFIFNSDRVEDTINYLYYLMDYDGVYVEENIPDSTTTAQ